MPAFPLRRVLLPAALLALSGCAGFGSAVTGVTTAGVAATVGSATGNPVLGIIAGAGASYGIDQGVKYTERRITDTSTTPSPAPPARSPSGRRRPGPWRRSCR